MSSNNYFNSNLEYRIDKYKHIYNRKTSTFRAELKDCVERFEDIYRRQTRSILLKELLGKEDK
jgi:hypothetical protein